MTTLGVLQYMTPSFVLLLGITVYGEPFTTDTLITFGLIWMVVLMLQIRQKGLTEKNGTRLLCLSLFWHFLDIIWICVFTVVYLMGVM